MVKPEWGTKYTCYKCGMRFFDLNKPEPVCPKCNANQLKAPKKASGVSSRARARAVIPEEPEVDEIPDGGAVKGVDAMGFDEIDQEEKDKT